MSNTTRPLTAKRSHENNCLEKTALGGDIAPRFLYRFAQSITIKLFHALILCATQIVICQAQETGKIYSVQGTVERRPKDSAAWATAVVESAIAAGDAIRTGDASRVAILGSDGIMVRLGPNSVAEFNGSSEGLSLENGDAHILSRDPHKTTSVSTTVVSGSIRGTEFAVSANATSAQYTVMEGAITLANNQGNLTLTSGDSSVVKVGAPLTKSLEPKPYNSVRWAFRYPALISRKYLESLFASGTDSDREALSALLSGNSDMASGLWSEKSTSGTLGNALIAWRANELGQAVKILRSLNSVDTRILESRILLQGGQLAEALRILSDVKKTSTLSNLQQAMIAAQTAIIFFVQGNIEDGFEAIKAGKTFDAANAELEYSESIGFQIVGDIDTAALRNTTALMYEPENPDLLARKAELLFGSGELADASKTALRASQIDPQNAEAQTVLGYISLARGDSESAGAAFDRALQIDSGLSKAFLGKGLVEISGGNLESGRLKIQEAVHLDPRVSLYRSYLGKAFFENKREGDARKELAIAKTLDPNDPTPYLYDAFNHLAEFEPISALDALEDSIARNNNRAVYRSRLLLDQDQATRSSGLGKVFSALDFVRPAQIEALKGLTDDPGNYSAHFLYKDALLGGSVDTAIISSEATGTLLAPAGFSSLLPSASSGASLNEYTTLFERAQSRTGIDTVVESKERRVDGSVVHFSGAIDYSYLFNYGTTYQDGYRSNDYDRRHNARALGQYEVTSDDKLLLEWIGIGSEQGDTTIDLDPETNDADSNFSFEDYSARLGWRHSWSAASTTLFQGLLINSHFNTEDLSQARGIPISVVQGGEEVDFINNFGNFSVNSRTRTRGGRIDLQHIYSTEDFSLVAGGTTLLFNERQRDSAVLLEDDVGAFNDLTLSSKADIDSRTYKSYGYLTVKPASWARIIAGGAYSSIHYAPRNQEPFSDETQNESRWTPKAGLFFTPLSSLTLRAAYFESMGTSSIRELESIEPVQVAGLRQLFDDQVATFSRNWAFGIDWKEPKSTYVGTEFLLRNLNQPGYAVADQFIVDADSGATESTVIEESYDGHSEEQTVLSYINQVLTKSLVASLEYDFTRREDDFFVFETRTHRSRLGLNYFDKSGVFAFTSGTYRYQDRDNYEPEVSDSEGFWVFSGGFGYQLPHRQGAIQFAVQNIFDNDFRYVPTSQDTRLTPGTNFTLGINLNF